MDGDDRHDERDQSPLPSQEDAEANGAIGGVHGVHDISEVVDPDSAATIYGPQGEILGVVDAQGTLSTDYILNPTAIEISGPYDSSFNSIIHAGSPPPQITIQPASGTSYVVTNPITISTAPSQPLEKTLVANLHSDIEAICELLGITFEGLVSFSIKVDDPQELSVVECKYIGHTLMQAQKRRQEKEKEHEDMKPKRNQPKVRMNRSGE